MAAGGVARFLAERLSELGAALGGAGAATEAEACLREAHALGEGAGDVLHTLRTVRRLINLGGHGGAVGLAEDEAAVALTGLGNMASTFNLFLRTPRFNSPLSLQGLGSTGKWITAKSMFYLAEGARPEPAPSRGASAPASQRPSAATSRCCSGRAPRARPPRGTSAPAAPPGRRKAATSRCCSGRARRVAASQPKIAPSR